MLHESFVRSPLNYTGNKYKLLSQLKEVFPEKIEGTFYDAFAGGFTVAANVAQGRVVANEVSKPVCGIVKEIQSMGAELFLEMVKEWGEEFDLCKENHGSYLRARDYYNRVNGFSSNCLLFTLLCHSFNNQLRFNSEGKFNMPFGNRTFSDATEKAIKRFAERLSSVEIVNGCYSALEPMAGDFVYADPPYLISTTTYTEAGKWDEQAEKDLLRKLDEWSERGVLFALSNVIDHKGLSNDILKSWAKRYDLKVLDRNYNNCSAVKKKASKESKTTEVVITNF